MALILFLSLLATPDNLAEDFPADMVDGRETTAGARLLLLFAASFLVVVVVVRRRTLVLRFSICLRFRWWLLLWELGLLELDGTSSVFSARA